MNECMKGLYKFYQWFSNWTWTSFCRKDKADFCPVICLCLYGAQQKLTLSVASLHRNHRITNPEQQGGTWAAGRNLTQTWVTVICKVSEAGSLLCCFAALLSYTGCTQPLFHGHPQIQAGQCILKKREKPAICSVPLLPKLHRIQTASHRA